MNHATPARFIRIAANGLLALVCVTSISCSQYDSKAYAEQAARIARSDAEELRNNARKFGEMAEAERERLRTLQQEIEKSKDLVLYFEAYQAWLDSLTKQEREQILAAKNDDDRLSIVRSIRKEQEIKLTEKRQRELELAQKETELNEKSASLDARERELRDARLRKNEMVSRIMRVAPEDQIAVYDWLTALVKKNRDKLLESMPEEMSRKMRSMGSDEATQTQMLIMALVNRKLSADPRFVSKEEFEQLRSRLTDDARLKIDGLEDHNQRVFVLQQWGWGGYWAKHYSHVTAAQLETFRKALKPALQALLEKETPIESEMHVRRLYARSQTLNVPPEKLDESGMGEAFAFTPRIMGPNSHPEEPPRKGPLGGPGGFRPGGPRPPRPGEFPGRPGEGPPPEERFGPGGPEGGPRGDRPPRGEGGFDDRPRDDRLPPF